LAVPSHESRGKYIRNIQPDISNVSEDPAVIAGYADLIYATCILHNYIRDQGVGLNDIASSASGQNGLRNIAFEARHNKVHSK
jgi:hypothetical protein